MAALASGKVTLLCGGGNVAGRGGGNRWAQFNWQGGNLLGPTLNMFGLFYMECILYLF